MANFCSECGAALTGSKRFCPECGISTDQTAADGQQTPTVVTADTSTAEATSDESAPVEVTVGTIPIGMLRVLAADPNEAARSFVAGHTSTPGDVLRALADDPTWLVQDEVASNPSTPGDVLAAFARSGRVEVMANPSTPADAVAEGLQSLADDPDEQYEEGTTREVLARAPSTRADVLRILATHIVRGSWHLPVCVAENPSTPVALLRTLATQLAFAVTRNPSTQDDVLRTLAADPVNWEPLAENPSTPVDVLTTIAANANDWVRELVAQNSSTPPAVLLGGHRRSTG